MNQTAQWPYIGDVPGYSTFKTIKPIEKGWSADKKYYIETNTENKRLLRVADISEFERKTKEYDVMQRIAALGIPMSQPIDFGICNQGASVYLLLTWCEGEEATVLLPTLPKTEQYRLGLMAGTIQRSIHAIETYPPSSEWAQKYNQKIDGYIESYKSCGLTFANDTLLLRYVEENRHLMDNRPMCLTHGDFHSGNMVVSPDNTLYVIDFQGWGIIDPYRELKSIMFSAAVSPHFATGQLRGYFEGEPPEDFWPLLAFYLAATGIHALPWSIQFGQEEIEFTYDAIDNILRWFNHMTNPVPTWYVSNWR